MLDVSHQFAPQVGHRGEDTAGDDIALDLRKPEFHLVQPGRVGWRVVEAYGGMRRQKGADLLRLMGREIVDDDVDRVPTRLTVDHRLEEGDELVARMTRHRAAEHFTGMRIERRIQRQRTVAVVLKAMAFRSPG